MHHFSTRFRPWLILYIKDALTPKRLAICGAFSPASSAIFTAITSSLVSLWSGLASPRRSTNPVRHWCFVLSAFKTHSRFAGRLFSLLPSMWLTVRPGVNPSQKAEATSLCSRYLVRLAPALTLICRYPWLPIHGDKFLAGLFCGAETPSLSPSVFLGNDLALPRFETSMNSWHRGDDLQISIFPPVCPYILQVSN